MIALLGLVACAGGVPDQADSGARIGPSPGGAGGVGGTGGAGSGGTGGVGGMDAAVAGSGASGTGGTAGFIIPDYPDAAKYADSGMDAGAVDAEVDAGPQYTCDDAMKNGKETGTDCGGPDCDPCPDGSGCVVADDCQSGYCGPGFTCSAPSCDDKTLNQDESDVDCGGTACDGCAIGHKCFVPEDCQSGSCDMTGHCACVPTATCDPGVCGTKPDGCGSVMNCGCGNGEACVNKACVEACDPNKCTNSCPGSTRCCTEPTGSPPNTCGCDLTSLGLGCQP